MEQKNKKNKARDYKRTTIRLLDILSGNECTHPDCSKTLIAGDNVSIISKICHIEAASENGPRYNKSSNDDERRSFENLILLCDEHHIMIDNKENESIYPVEVLKEWKYNHSLKIKSHFGIKKYNSRIEIRNIVKRILLENKIVFDKFGPNHDEYFNPESEYPKKWKQGIYKTIIPNNQKLLLLIDLNYGLLNDGEESLFAEFRQHVLDFEDKHLNNNEISGATFPIGMNNIFK